MRLLIVEDEEDLRIRLKSRLSEAGYAVDAAADGRDAAFLGQEYNFDLAIVDWELPFHSGLDLVRAWRERGRGFPILMLTVRDRWQDKVAALEAGADDYLVKPFQFEELLARANALLRRAAGMVRPAVQCGPFHLDTVAQRVSVEGRTVELTAQEYRILEYLMLHPGAVVSKTNLIEHVYDQDFDCDSNVIEVFIARLRRKLDPDNRYRPIETLRGRGYRLTLGGPEP